MFESSSGYGRHEGYTKHMPYKDPDRQREYQRQYVARRRAEYLAGKVCAVCGSTTDLQIDHVDPTLKEPSLRVRNNIFSWSAKRRAVELAKCQILCLTHHKEKTRKDREPPHGTKSRYSSRGCRCEPCTAANTEAQRKRRARLQAPLT